MNDKKDVRDRLVAVARDLFARQGYEGTSVRDLARRARVNLGAVTYYFGSKEGLYHEVIASFAEPLVERVGQAAAHASTPLDRIEAVVRTFLDYIGAHPDMPKILLRQLAAERPLPAAIERAMQRNFGVLAEAIRAGQQDGSVRPGDPVLLTLSVMAQPFHFAIAARVALAAAGVDSRDPATHARIVEHIAQAVRWVIAANPMTP